MRSSLFRVPAVAALTLSGLLLATGVAQAAPDTTITVASDDGVVLVDEPLDVEGACIDGSDSAVVSFDQDGDRIAEESVDLAADGSWSTTLDISDAVDGPAQASVECFAYGQQTPLDSAVEDVYVFGFDIDVFEVTVSPSTVRMGASFTVSGTCPAGTEVAAVAAGNAEALEPFATATVTPAADGTTTATLTVPRTGAEAGDALAVIACGVDAESAFGDEPGDELPTAFGLGEFTVLAAPAAPARPVTAAPVLANTGSDNGPLTGLAVGLLVLGLGAHAVRRATR